MNNAADNDQKLTQLQQGCQKDLEGAMERVRKDAQDLFAQPDSDALPRLREGVVELSAVAATLGLADVSALATALDLKLAGLKSGNRDSSGGAGVGMELNSSIARLLESLQETVSYQGQDGQAVVTKPVGEMGQAKHGLRGHDVFVFSEDYEGANWLTRQIQSFGYAARALKSLEKLGEAMAADTPAALVVDGPMATERLDSIQSMLMAGGDSELTRPVLIGCGEDTLDLRLAAARAGAQAYFTKPLDVSGLVDKLDALVTGAMSEPYRILIVDDDPTLAKIYGLIFQERGWVPYVLTDPMRILEPLAEFSPDIVLLDLYMPSVTGMELAAVIRQYEAYAAIPVVYLSMEEDIAKQVRAVARGGDDFLSKTMRPDHLASAVESHARRYRVLRSLLSKDGLTGLLNHSHLRVRIQAEVRRARRTGGNLSLAMLDLDHFKKVNDTYGHLVGDKVLRTLSRFLRQRLRGTDIIGRYGGEEFAVLLLDTEGPGAAAKLMDAIREDFATLEHLAEGERFQTTFSCGLACFPEFGDSYALTDAADKALYEAKGCGRNRVVVASGSPQQPEFKPAPTD